MKNESAYYSQIYLYLTSSKDPFLIIHAEIGGYIPFCVFRRKHHGKFHPIENPIGDTDRSNQILWLKCTLGPID